MRRILVLFIIGLLVCIVVGCKAKKEFIEVDRWQHDTLTIVDTVKITEYINVKDSTSEQSQTQLVHKDSTITVVHWNYVTYDSIGNISSMLDYNSSTQHGNSSNTASQSTSTSTTNSETKKEENASHIESSGHAGKEYVINEVERDLYWWQKALMWTGGISIVLFGVFIAVKIRKVVNR